MTTSQSLEPGNVSWRKTILVVDDDDSVRAGLAEVLAAEGYDVASAINGIQALTTLRQRPCHLALVDINMPLLNGWGSIGELRRLDPRLPLLIITARPDQRAIARETGIELMEKPLDIASLLRRIRELLDVPSASSDDGEPPP